MQSRPPTRDSAGRAVSAAGYAGLLGFPNSGKSSILNLLAGATISAVTKQPSTTRMAVSGLWTREEHQVCFVDTPDLATTLGLPVMDWLDIYCLVLDSRSMGERLESREVSALFERANSSGIPVILALTFIDFLPRQLRPALLNQAALRRHFSGLTSCCPAQGTGMDGFLGLVMEQLPRRERLFPSGCSTPHSERFLVSEQIRTQLYGMLPPDVAASTAVQVEEFSFRDNKTYVRANILVARHSSKGMVIGRKGVTLQSISEHASAAAEALLGRAIYLDLWVKVREGWPERASDLMEFGYVC